MQSEQFYGLRSNVSGLGKTFFTMHLADHIRPLLRDHDCVIIPDFGGLVAEPVPARFSAARLQLGPPAKQVAFNQSLTRNDGLLVDALSQYLRVPATQAREILRHAVEDLHQELRLSQRTELPGIGVFRQAPDRGLSFDYTGTDNLLPAAFGLPALSVRPVLATDARLAREKRPALLLPAARRRPARPLPWARALKRVSAGFAATLLVGTGYLLSVRSGLLPAGWLPPAARTVQMAPPVAQLPAATPAAAAAALPAAEPQQATLAHNGWSTAAEATSAEELPRAETGAARPESVAVGEAAFSPAAAVAAVQNQQLPAATKLPEQGPARTAPGIPVGLPGKPTPGLARSEPGAITPRTGSSVKVMPSKRYLASVSEARKPAAAPVTPAKVVPAAAKAPAAKVSAVKTPAVASLTTTVNRPLGRSYVIAGAFGSLAGAEVCRRNLVRAGFTNAKVLRPNRTTRRFRASAIDFADVASARLTAAQLRAKSRARTFYDVYTY